MPAYYLLAIYVAFALLALLFLFFNIYHLAKFGLQGSKTGLLITGYILSFFFFASITLLLISPHDWTDRISTSDVFRIRFDQELPQL